ncbi:MAG: tRNA (adenosine(37)-N6)-threonylcarbamoyltransferase complex ATPase subunit type 1 TsaE [Armatimonadetes bacterium]|nr:tRNA (adenosine(37)-N6)-threonylcarbamoyltransferase complex ATPase subunit type 1 TsaE [Armatimonadota bacterium]
MVTCPDEASLRRLAASFQWKPGDVVLLSGDLGAGKTTFVRGYLESLGISEPVRSPTFNLLQVFATEPPVLHADLYRVKSAEGIGLEDYLDSHACLIEWPDRLHGLIDPKGCWQVHIDFEAEGRSVTVTPPDSQT